MAQYDPNKRYTWTPEDKFELTGQEFGLILNTIRSYLMSEDAARYNLMLQTNEVIQNIMAKGVEADIIKEAPQEPAEAPVMEVLKQKSNMSAKKKMLKRKDGTYSQRGLWDNIRANRGSGRKPTKAMLEQERKIRGKTKKK